MSKILFFISPTINSFADKEKGSKANRTACAVSHFKNSVVSNAQIVTAAGLATAIGHFMPVVNMKKPAKINWKNFQEAANALKKDFKAAPKFVKIAAGAAIAISLINRTFKKLGIEQKYLDRAILEETKKERAEKKLLEKMAKTETPQAETHQTETENKTASK